MSPNANTPKPNRSSLVLLVLLFLVIVIVGGYFGLKAWTKHELSTTRTSLVTGYNTQTLTAPFVLRSKQWQPGAGPFASSGSWRYSYVANFTEQATLAAAKAQLGRGAYQVVATKPDQIGSGQATLYRDLITEDVALTVVIGPSHMAAGPTPVTVTLSPQTGDQ